MDWGKYSEESHYATAGKSPAAESASAASSDASRKGKKREAAMRREERRPQEPAPSRSQELNGEAEQQRLQVCLPVLTVGHILQVACGSSHYAPAAGAHQVTGADNET